MKLSRRDLAVAGALTLAATSLGGMPLVGPALAELGDEERSRKPSRICERRNLKQDKAALETMTLPQLTYSHSDGRIEDKAQFIKGVMNRKATLQVAGISGSHHGGCRGHRDRAAPLGF